MSFCSPAEAHEVVEVEEVVEEVFVYVYVLCVCMLCNLMYNAVWGCGKNASFIFFRVLEASLSSRKTV
jgi:hypothetical protein